MQKLPIQVTALILALSLLFALSACGTTGQSASVSAQNETSEPDTADVPEVSAEVSADAAPETSTEEAVSADLYPIYDELTTVDAFIAVGGFIQPYLDNDFNNVLSIQEAEKATNIHVDWSYVDQDMFIEKFQLLVASEDYPDIWASLENFYVGGTDALVGDGVCVDIVPYLEEYMPDYKAMLDSDELLTKQLTSDSGYMSTISGRNVLVNQGCEIRKDWLDDLGLEIPKTYDELHEVLSAFKAEKNARNEGPLLSKRLALRRLRCDRRRYGRGAPLAAQGGRENRYLQLCGAGL